MTRTMTAEIIEIIEAMPGISSKQINELMPHVSIMKVSATLHSLYFQGKVLRERHKQPSGVGRDYYTYTMNPNPKPVAKERKDKPPVPTESALQVRVAELEAKLAELTQWKREAIARFPDLDVDPIVLQAREIVAADLEAHNDTTLAQAVRQGQKDGILPMRVTIAALNGV